jgi:uncharacterized protein YukE
LGKAANQLRSISENYTSLYKSLFEKVQAMGAAWDADDNLAFVSQINGFCDDLQNMALKFQTAASALDMQKQNYEDRMTSNVTEVKKLIN